MDKVSIINSLKTLKMMCVTNCCKDCPLGFKLEDEQSAYYKCVLAYCSPGELRLEADDTWRATENTKELEFKYGKTN